jgi:UDP:flavonoid glycosyltransferase YjiC (YdhE family)
MELAAATEAAVTVEPDIIVVSSAYGSQGDVGPLLALARALQEQQRCLVVFVGNEYFRRDVEAIRGLRFVGVGTKESYEDLLANSQKRTDKRALVRYWLSHLEEHYAVLEALASGRRRVVVVAHPLVCRVFFFFSPVYLFEGLPF